MNNIILHDTRVLNVIIHNFRITMATAVAMMRRMAWVLDMLCSHDAMMTHTHLSITTRGHSSSATNRGRYRMK